jgi:hypothetical protein
MVGGVFGTQPVVVTRDAFGNLSANGLPASLAVTVSLPNGSGPLIGTTTRDIGSSAGNGTVSYFNLRIDSAGAKQLAAAAAALGPAVSDSFTVAKADQTISFGEVSNKVYGDAPFALSATASSGLPVGFGVVSGPLSVSNVTASITGVGEAIIRASQPGDLNFNPAPSQNQTCAVARAALTITEDNQARAYGGSNPPLTGVIVGVQYTDNLSATYSTTATAASPSGTYPIVPSLDDPEFRGSNYDLTLNDGVLTVTNIPPILITDASFSNGTFVLSFLSASGPGYALECKPALPEATWIPLTNVTGSGGVMTLTDPEATNQSRFYRIHLQ